MLGRLGAPWGVHGWLKVESYTDPPEVLLDYPVWRLAPASADAPSGRTARVLAGRPYGGRKGLLVQLEGLVNPEQARELATQNIWVARAELPPPAANEYYWVDLIGLAVRTLEGVALGRVSHFVELPANPVLVVRDGDKEHWVPMAPAHVKRVDLGEGVVEVDWDPSV